MFILILWIKIRKLKFCTWFCISVGHNLNTIEYHKYRHNPLSPVGRVERGLKFFGLAGIIIIDKVTFCLHQLKSNFIFGSHCGFKHHWVAYTSRTSVTSLHCSSRTGPQTARPCHYIPTKTHLSTSIIDIRSAPVPTIPEDRNHS